MISAVYFCRVFIIFGAQICIYAASRILIAGVSPRRVVSHRPGGVLWRALTKACGAIGQYCFDTLVGDDVASSALTRLSARGELFDCFGALSCVIQFGTNSLEFGGIIVEIGFARIRRYHLQTLIITLLKSNSV